MLTPHKYPTGRADFESIINEGFLYVDKTGRMYEMIGCRTVTDWVVEKDSELSLCDNSKI